MAQFTSSSWRCNPGATGPLSGWSQHGRMRLRSLRQLFASARRTFVGKDALELAKMVKKASRFDRAGVMPVTGSRSTLTASRAVDSRARRPVRGPTDQGHGEPHHHGGEPA
jgi:hypothetical protein